MYHRILGKTSLYSTEYRALDISAYTVGIPKFSVKASFINCSHQRKSMCFPLCWNSVCISCVSSELIEIFKLNLAALIQVLIEAFWHCYNWDLKYLHMRKLQLIIDTYYLQVSWHDMNLKLTLGIRFDK